MKIKRVTRYISDCGKGFWKKRACLTHDENCKCWTNPRNKACKTCCYGGKVKAEPDVGMEGYWECGNIHVEEHSGAPEGHDYISVGCPFHELVNNNTD